MEIVKWNDYDDCPMGSKKWGNFVDGEFAVDDSYIEGDFPIVWCNVDGCPCSATSGKNNCLIYRNYITNLRNK
ncbi:hypothetical protein Tsac_2864 [Thermoanaerobacterium phage THSA-485A]|uniref:hypothetical protein n=1 Tax=Thermoanaerobacterium phage THSA-485A TaxID=1126885 RepID=UPI000263F849|nr:hypothetical protein Tsac_2864 [Thermoanaerobacterium phage THSA-485A]AFK87717.1 hypothetical protein Tsac_2864 [Thermoanaerobacterium phage THSA-485A]